MSLLYWLPMLGSLENQGLSNAQPVNHGATVNTAGKLGSCYDFSGTQQYIDTGYKEELGSGDFSIAAWFKLTDSGSRKYQPIISNKNTAAISVGCAIYYNHSQQKFLWSTADGSSATEVWMLNQYPYATMLNTWHHIVMVRNSSDAKKGYFYIDGVRYELSSVPAIRNVTNTTYNMMIGDICNHASSNYSWTGSICDLRIYDNAISAREAKELSKGLFLHYPLSDPFIEETTNLAPSPYGISGTCYNGATSKYSYGSTTDMYRVVGEFEGRKCTKVYMGTSGQSAYPYVYFNNQTEVGETKTLSFDYFPSILNQVGFYKLTADVDIKYTVNGVSGTARNTVVLPVNVGKWNHIVITGTNIGDKWGGLGYMQIGQAPHTSSTNNYWLFSNVQVEIKDHPTGYTPYGTTRSDETVYDVSGFGNNGITIGTPTCSSDTPRYNISTVFDGTTHVINNTSTIHLSNEFTISWWGKINTWRQVWEGMFLLQNTTALNTASGTYSIANAIHANTANKMALTFRQGGTNYPFDHYEWTYTVGTWGHYACTYKDGVIIMYQNGVQTYTATIDNNSSGDYYYTIGKRVSNCNCQMSDFRIYNTALSAEDILSLYNAPMTLANNGTLLTHGEFSEV